MDEIDASGGEAERAHRRPLRISHQKANGAFEAALRGSSRKRYFTG